MKLNLKIKISIFLGIMGVYFNGNAEKENSLKALEQALIVAPAGAVEAQTFSILKKKFSQLESLSWAPGVYWHSASDKDRAEQLVKALTKRSSFWVWCLRGGYGCARLIPALWKAVKNDKLIFPKGIIGYSDVTCLHLWADAQGWKGVHGVMPGDWGKPWIQKNNFFLLNEILANSSGVLHYKNLRPFNEAAKSSKLLKGKVIGGNLTLLVHSIGTSWQLKSKGKIIIIEDLNIQGYQIDRALYHLTEAQVLEGAKAIIFGAFYGKNTDWEKAIKRFAEHTEIPVFYWPYFGHGAYNYPIPFGFESQLKYNANQWIWSIPYNFSEGRE
ncbi:MULTISPECIES: LD-carboxypeptidase [Holospora]|uniref:Putative carboxypeptidase n=2 Tax=Holospora TaxID=44747 RepID=A0A061JFQ6_9PROT|nr:MULTISPECIES: LD-carboxypeptidase [Holospora]ETZ04511.1 putative carboxypeptidase [Holospora undulata HU1]GAJ45930.1 putative carboxypeptidase [Holospora elegans E1]